MKLYIPPSDKRIGSQSYIDALTRVGISLTVDVHKADIVLPLTDRGAQEVQNHPRFMPAASLNIILDRLLLSETGMPTIPTTFIPTPDLAPEGSIVKLRNSADPRSGYVYQPHLGFPQTDLDISFAVNSAGEVFDFANLALTHLDAKMPGVNAMASQSDVDEVLPMIRSACQRLGIRGGIHNVQFLKCEGGWCLIDWNPRPAFVHTEGLAAVHSYMEQPLAFMANKACEKQSVFFLTKPYWERPIPFYMEMPIRDLGLVPRRVKDVNGFPRISGVGDTEAEVLAKFEQLESLL